MATLLVEYGASRSGGPLTGRVLIGRRPGNAIVIDDPAVSRLHAWIDWIDDQPFVADAFSRTGTYVNDLRIRGKHPLKDGDAIRIGPATLIYSAGSVLPPDVALEEFHFDEATVAEQSGGLLFDCACGAPLWAPRNLVGRSAKCLHCGQRLIVPKLSGSVARLVEPMLPVYEPVPTETKPALILPSGANEEVCSICQTVILETDERAACPACGLTFHQQCWEENRGCSAYGCSQVNILDAGQAEATTESTEAAEAVAGEAEEAAAAEMEASFPWPIALLALSVLALVVGAVAFGVPSLIVLIATLVFWFRAKPGTLRPILLSLCLVLCIAGIGVGLIVSRYWWMGQPLAIPLVGTRIMG